jgi:hypothetical protein
MITKITQTNQRRRTQYPNYIGSNPFSRARARAARPARSEEIVKILQGWRIITTERRAVKLIFYLTAPARSRPLLIKRTCG